jgi:BarA-like signal transduction histidine kinase
MLTDRRLTNIGTILLTSTVLPGPERLDAAGVRACLSKPVRSSELHDALLRTTRHRTGDPTTRT